MEQVAKIVQTPEVLETCVEGDVRTYVVLIRATVLVIYD